MTDKVQKIREGIERLKSQLIKGACASQIAMETRCKEEAYNEVLAILDTMQEEPIRNPIDFEKELYKAFGQVKDFTLCMRIAKRFYNMGKNSQEPVGEDLEQASKEWLKPQLDKSYADYGETNMMELTHFDGYAMLDAIEFGAKWQKKRESIPSKDLEELINSLSKRYPEVSFAKLSRIAVRVAQWQKEKMMANTADAMIGLPYENKDGGYTHLIDVSRPLPVGDNKIAIIFKED